MDFFQTVFQNVVRKSKSKQSFIRLQQANRFHGQHFTINSFSTSASPSSTWRIFGGCCMVLLRQLVATLRPLKTLKNRVGATRDRDPEG